jgi:pimeloyl-ACP methyl ester carboxylesterase
MTRANGIEICYAQDGASADPAVLLVHGLGCQLIQWPDSFVAGLVAAGFNVLRMDNRDVGRSAKLDALGAVDIMALILAFQGGPPARPPYTLRTMADDAVGLLDALGLTAAHLVGVSMGGMIAQRIALHHPQRVLSLTSIMSSSGASDLPPPDPPALASITAVPVSQTRADMLVHLGASWDLIGGPHFKSTAVGMGRKTEAAFDRGRHPAGILRQLAAIMGDTGRADSLPEIRTPTLVIHGDADPLVPLVCGEDTARRIPGATLKVMPNMGHDLPEPLMPGILAALTTHLHAAAGASDGARPRAEG